VTGSQEYDRVFCFTHDYAQHHYFCDFITGAADRCSCGFQREFAAAQAYVASLQNVAEAAGRHCEDCCRTDIRWTEQMVTHQALVDALEAAGL
jgi:hypothetical protein